MRCLNSSVDVLARGSNDRGLTAYVRRSHLLEEYEDGDKVGEVRCSPETSSECRAALYNPAHEAQEGGTPYLGSGKYSWLGGNGRLPSGCDLVFSMIKLMVDLL